MDVDRRKVWFWIVSLSVLIITGFIVGGLGISSLLTWQSGELYEDPLGRFSMQTGPWQEVETNGPYTQFKLANPSMNMYLLVLKARTINDAFTQALEVVGFDPGLLTGGPVTIVGDWRAYSREDSAGFSYGLAGQFVGDNAFIGVIKADKPGVSIEENAAVMRALSSIKIAGKDEIVSERYADLEAGLR